LLTHIHGIVRREAIGTRLEQPPQWIGALLAAVDWKEKGRSMMQQYTFQDLIEIARTVIRAFEAVEQRPWSIEATLIELMKQTGDLARRVMTAEHYYLPDREHDPAYRTTTDEIGDELADVLYCVIRIAEHYHIDLEQAHLQARRNELRYLKQEVSF
jgi:NTP pyrophosphatase (non-canonical NTP hydrolase)